MITGFVLAQVGRSRRSKAGAPLYDRIQSDGFLIELDDTPEEANHVHIVIRSSTGDYARDALAHPDRQHH